MTDTTAPKTRTYRALKQTGAEYLAARWAEIDDFYEGGYDLLDKVGDYLPPRIGEPEERYRERLRCASYLNYLAPIADFFTSNLFEQDISVKQPSDAQNAGTLGDSAEGDKADFYTEFERDADLQGNGIAGIFKQVFRQGILKERAILAIDMPTAPDDQPAPQTKAEEDRLGLARAYAFLLPIDQMTDWKRGPHGDFQWCKLRKAIDAREGPDDPVGLIREEFKLWFLDGPTARWETYLTEAYVPGDRAKEPKPDDPIPLVGAGDTTFPKIPLVELAIDKGLCVGNKVGPVQREHFQRRSNLNAAEEQALFEMLVIGLGPEMTAIGSALPSEIQMDSSRRGAAIDPVATYKRMGALVVGSGDNVNYKGPSGVMHALSDQRLKDLVEEIYRVVNQMAASIKSTTTSLGRSAASKAEDRGSTETILTEYGSAMRKFAKKVYDLIAAARGEKILWAVHGMDKFELEDRAAILDEALQADAVNIPSVTFHIKWRTSIASALLRGKATPAEMDVIGAEIKEGTHAEEAFRAKAQAAPLDPNTGTRQPPETVLPDKLRLARKPAGGAPKAA
jgi:hypothetical protein